MLDLNEVYLAGARLAVGGGRGGGRVTKWTVLLRSNVLRVRRGKTGVKILVHLLSPKASEIQFAHPQENLCPLIE